MTLFARVGWVAIVAGLSLVPLSYAATTRKPVKQARKAVPHAQSSAARSLPGRASAGNRKGVLAVRKGKPGHEAVRKGAASPRTVRGTTRVRLVDEESKPTAASRKLSVAFVQSEQLRPMAQQLAQSRTAAAFAGVLTYAQQHSGEGAAAAYLAMGHAHALDRRYADAGAAYRQAAAAGEALRDYAQFLGAQAALQNHDPAGTLQMLADFRQKYPSSIFASNATVLAAQALLAQNDGAGALRALAQDAGQPASQKADFLLTEGKANELAGNRTAAAVIFRQIYVRLPFSPEAAQARQELQGMQMGPSAGERKLHADALFNAKRYGEAGAEYHAIQQNDSSLSQVDRDALEIYAAVCDLRLKHLSRHDAEKLPQTGDDSAALRLYILAEIARNDGDEAGNRSLLQQMEQRFPQSRWLEEALYSSGNMYLIKRTSSQAIELYQELFRRFPNSTYAPSSHWRAAWLNYRSRNYPEAARLMDEHIIRYPASAETPAAIYWRGRLYEDPEHNFAQAQNFYNTLSTSYRNFYYAILARERLHIMGAQNPVSPAFSLASVRTPPAATLVQELPENDPHLIKARLLANAGLNEYIGPEIQASGSSAQWGALAQAEIYRSYGENVRALQAVKRSGASFFVLPVQEVPTVYWQLLFPRPYWNDLAADSAKNGLDPYLVASLIRQESEFNPAAVSKANAYGLMQMIPAVGKAQANKQGIRRFQTGMLLDPSINLALGTANLKQVMDRYSGQAEYALAAYNAGDTPVRRWMAENNYKDIPEFVESIPYSETRDYVQSILRNREMYRQLYAGQ